MMGVSSAKSNAYKEQLEQIRQIREHNLHQKEQQGKDFVNSLDPVIQDYWKEIADKKDYYTNNFKTRFTSNDGQVIVTKSFDSDPNLNKLRKATEEQLRYAAVSHNGSNFFNENSTSIRDAGNSYSGYGSSASFMVRALSYIMPMLIIKPLPELTYDQDWPIMKAGQWSQFSVFVTAERVYNPTLVAEESTNSGRVGALFGESVFENYTLRQDLVWDSTPMMYADQSLQNGLINYVFMQSMERGFREKVNSIYLNGLTAVGKTGMLNDPNITRITSGGSWSAVGAAGEKNSTIDLINLITAVEQNSNGVYTAKKVMASLKLKPFAVYPRSQYVSTSPAMYLEAQKIPYDLGTTIDQIRWNPYLNFQGTGGTHMAIAYDPKIEYAHIGLPVFMFAEPLSYESHKYKIPFITRTGGFRVIQSPSLVILDSVPIT